MQLSNEKRTRMNTGPTQIINLDFAPNNTSLSTKMQQIVNAI